MHTFLTILILILVFPLALLLARTWQLERGTDQVLFTSGTATTIPNGQYKGSVEGPKVSWIGKYFDAEHSRGINKFSEENGTVSDKYPFLLSLGGGVHDPKQVIKIDYNVPENPWWLRRVLDEVVEVAPGEYLGKLQLRILPTYPFTLIYFRLKYIP